MYNRFRGAPRVWIPMHFMKFCNPVPVLYEAVERIADTTRSALITGQASLKARTAQAMASKALKWVARAAYGGLRTRSSQEAQ